MALELFFPEDNNNNKHNFLLYGQAIAVFLYFIHVTKGQGGFYY